MIINKIDNIYTVHIFNNYIKDINIFDTDDIVSFLKSIIIKVKKKYNLNGLCNVSVYYDNNYGIIMEIDNYNKDEVILDVNIKIYMNAIFMMEINYDINAINNYDDIYYYKDRFYTYYDFNNDSKVIFKNSLDIMDKGLKVK